MDKVEEIVSVSDPGEIGREEHNWGDRFSVVVSNVVAWLFPILMMVIVTQVILRTLGRSDIGPGNQAWMDDLQWWLYGAAIIIAVGYAVTTNSHVRVDIFFANFSERKKTRIEIFGLVWLFLPFIVLSFDLMLHYALSSIAAREGSDSPNGLHRLYLLKSFVALGFVFIGAVTWAAYIRLLRRLTEPALWKQLLIAFPSTMFMVNLAIFYALYWWVYLTGPEDLNVRRITREPIFEHTILITAIVTVLIIGLAWLLRRREPKGV